ncbi:protein kinase [Streptomyces sp. NPDC059092]|uniref:protein kinase domain-containing protein n=1 Tax=Streptomyces sp. NPDC059092 TaxID=3346725 RepID=UPI00367AB4A3
MPPDDSEAAKRLKKEAQLAARLHHANIVPVFDLVEAEAACWIVMEFVPSRSLAQVVTEDGVLTPEEAGSVGCQMAAALAKSHAEGVVHGDVTPGPSPDCAARSAHGCPSTSSPRITPTEAARSSSTSPSRPPHTPPSRQRPAAQHRHPSALWNWPFTGPWPSTPAPRPTASTGPCSNCSPIPRPPISSRPSGTP